jgi:polar amino acid transport system substrate-binding protein
MKSSIRIRYSLYGTLIFVVLSAAVSAIAADVPPPGASPRIDAIHKAGALRVAVIANPPWLMQNTSGNGPAWSGPAWALATEAAKRLGVTLQPVPVSNETKVPVLASNQVDISIAPLAETPERLKVVDFVLYSSTSDCVFGLKSNPRFMAAKTIDDLNSPDLTIAYLVGSSESHGRRQGSTRRNCVASFRPASCRWRRLSRIGPMPCR